MLSDERFLQLCSVARSLAARQEPFMLARIDIDAVPQGWALLWGSDSMLHPNTRMDAESMLANPEVTAAGWLTYESGYRDNHLATPTDQGVVSSAISLMRHRALLADDSKLDCGALDEVGRLLSESEKVLSSSPEAKLDVHDQVDLLAYEQGYERIQAGIVAGEIYQANLTYRRRGTFVGDPIDWFAQRVQRLRPRFARLGFDGKNWVVCLSPEELVSAVGTSVTTSPIKGTRRLSRQGDGDARFGWTDKERAEHVMIVDMSRNDLSRLSGATEVHVFPMMGEIVAGNLIHLESTVRCRVESMPTAAGLLAVTLPGASVTGAPKRQAMRVIAEVETTPRGVYCGAVGLHWPGWFSSWALPIRTAVIDSKGAAVVASGGGIVADSALQDERVEANDKLYWVRDAN